jgi:hypothetical protein
MQLDCIHYPNGPSPQHKATASLRLNRRQLTIVLPVCNHGAVVKLLCIYSASLVLCCLIVSPAAPVVTDGATGTRPRRPLSLTPTVARKPLLAPDILSTCTSPRQTRRISRHGL